MRETESVEQAFLIVVIAVAVVGVAGAVVALLLGGRSWDGYGADALLKDSDGGDPRRPAGATTGASAQRDDEVRQMLQARNARRARRGEPPLDVEAELARLTRPEPSGPEIDPELREEIRGLVLARNARRERRGEPPLDVEAEITRQIDQLNL
jgi:hypothetical protein